MELQFLEHHKWQYMELSSDFANSSFMQKSRTGVAVTALENMKELILLDLKILLGADIDWQHSARQPELATAALLQADGDDDRSGLSKDRDKGTASSNPADAANDEAVSLAPAAAAADAAAPDPKNFLPPGRIKIGIRRYGTL